MTEEEGNLGELTIRLIVIVLFERVKFLVGSTMNNLVTPLVVRLVLMDDPRCGC